MTMEIDEKRAVEVGEIGNYYGGLNIVEADGKYYWTIGDWDGYHWREIPKYLYDALMKYVVQ